MAQEDVFKKIVSHCKEYGFVFPSSDIYDGLAAVYDYGQNGVELKNNIKEYWWKSMVLLHDNIVGIDSAIFMHPTIWKASGHVDAFNDPLIDNRDSKKRYRADVLIEDQIGKYEEKIEKEIAKARKRFGDSFDEAKFRETNPRVLEHQKKRDDLHARYTEAMQGPNLEALKQIIIDEESLTLSAEQRTGPTCVSSTSCSLQRWVPLLMRQARFICVLKQHRVSSLTISMCRRPDV